ncbi:MAG: efflux RND transporter periplasmic adaptor subunit [Planctomycetes bacterium]|nr:efflux RND transporter periplasmic adaptor subunit [Planctomycetota bacterium]
MKTKFPSISGPVVRGVLLAVGMTAVVVVLMLWLIGTFHPKVDRSAAGLVGGRPLGDRAVEPVISVTIPLTESAVGAIRPVHEVEVASKLLAKVAQIKLRAGEAVEAGEVIVRLEDSDLRARKDQSAAAVAAARAVRDQAKIELERVQKLREQNAASQIELDRVNAAMLSAQADLERAEWQLTEAETILAYATLTSPIDGIVVDKRVEAGDTVTPGQILAKLYDAKRMQLVASVRESLTHQLKVGQTIAVEIDALRLECHGQISEIVPEAESASRTFAVKVTGPCPKGVYPNMFGRLIVPLGEQQVLVVPRVAVRQVGQLSVVDVVEGESLRRRSVQLGRELDGGYEVLSGLREGEKVATVTTAGTQPAAARSMGGKSTASIARRGI